ncbi:hypothetical protein [Candidatus Chloroploca asiatica]|uniref:hypothetical protein n=1 Tax=Candidatus Chloroploca asiatica TaxID=1506545 RepID=UPI001558FF9B|nr:hypothetical protein [Candidatus Chloroploca asiatica]
MRREALLVHRCSMLVALFALVALLEAEHVRNRFNCVEQVPQPTRPKSRPALV